MKITKKLFRQLITGKIISDIPVEELFFDEHKEKIKKAQEIATEIIEFAEQYNLFNPDLK